MRAVFGFVFERPATGERDEGLVGVVVVHVRAVAGFGPRIRDAEARGEMTDVRFGGRADGRVKIAVRRLEAHHVVENALGAGQAVFGESACRAVQIAEPRHAALDIDTLGFERR